MKIELNKSTITAWQDGYDSGLYWPDAWNYRPGGPFIMSGNYNEKVKAQSELSVMVNRAWLQGWDEGHAEKLRLKQVNHLIGTDENKKYHTSNAQSR